MEANIILSSAMRFEKMYRYKNICYVSVSEQQSNNSSKCKLYAIENGAAKMIEDNLDSITFGPSINSGNTLSLFVHLDKKYVIRANNKPSTSVNGTYCGTMTLYIDDVLVASYPYADKAIELRLLDDMIYCPGMFIIKDSKFTTTNAPDDIRVYKSHKIYQFIVPNGYRYEWHKDGKLIMDAQYPKSIQLHEGGIISTSDGIYDVYEYEEQRGGLDVAMEDKKIILTYTDKFDVYKKIVSDVSDGGVIDSQIRGVDKLFEILKVAISRRANDIKIETHVSGNIVCVGLIIDHILAKETHKYCLIQEDEATSMKRKIDYLLSRVK